MHSALATRGAHGSASGMLEMSKLSAEPSAHVAYRSHTPPQPATATLFRHHITTYRAKGIPDINMNAAMMSGRFCRCETCVLNAQLSSGFLPVMAQNVGIESIWRPEFAFGAPVEEVDLNEGEGDMVEVEGWSPFDDNCLTLAIQTAWSADEAAEGVETKVESEGHDPRDYYVRDLIDPLALMEMMQCESIVDFKDRVRKMPA